MNGWTFSHFYRDSMLVTLHNFDVCYRDPGVKQPSLGGNGWRRPFLKKYVGQTGISSPNFVWVATTFCFFLRRQEHRLNPARSTELDLKTHQWNFPCCRICLTNDFPIHQGRSWFFPIEILLMYYTVSLLVETGRVRSRANLTRWLWEEG